MNLQLAENIKRLRRERNLTQDDIATALGISYQAVSRWETGLSYPDVELLPALSSILDVSMDELFGMDEQTEQKRLEQYGQEIGAVTDIDEEIGITRSYIAMLPGNTYLKYRLMAAYKAKDFDFAMAHLDEIRRLCSYIVAHTTERDWWRDMAILDMIAMESDDKVDGWLKTLDNRTIITSAKALTHRYDWRAEIDKYNEAIQKDIIFSLTQMFNDDFCKRSAETYKNAKSRADGQKLVLKTIDTFRDPSIEIDGWIATRMFAYFRLAAGEIGSDRYEAGYVALEKAVDLYIAYDELPEDTVLRYNCCMLDMLTERVDKSGRNSCAYALAGLTKYRGWEWFNDVRHEERYHEQIRRLRARVPGEDPNAPIVYTEV